MAGPTPALFFNAVELGGLIFARLEGAINEDNRLSERMPPVAGKKLLLHLRQVERINSCGVRDWVRWVQELESRGNTVLMVDCSPVVVQQINLVKNFCGVRGHVVSFIAPYFCQTCDKEVRERIVTAAVRSTAEAPPAICETCGEPLVFDDLVESYFAFVREHRARPIDADVASSMNKFDDVMLATKVATLKEITDGDGRVGSNPARLPGTPRPTRQSGQFPHLGTPNPNPNEASLKAKDGKKR